MTIRHQSMDALKGPRGKLGKLAGHMICCSGAQGSRSKIEALTGGISVSSNGSEENTPFLLSLYIFRCYCLSWRKCPEFPVWDRNTFAVAIARAANEATIGLGGLTCAFLPALQAFASVACRDA